MAYDLDIEAVRNVLIDQIEEQRLEKELARIVGQVWNEIEESLKLERKPRYA